MLAGNVSCSCIFGEQSLCILVHAHGRELLELRMPVSFRMACIAHYDRHNISEKLNAKNGKSFAIISVCLASVTEAKGRF